MPTLEFVGQSVQDSDQIQSDPSRLVNMYRQNLDGSPILRGVLGTEEFAALDGVFLRAMHEFDNRVYVALGGKVWKVRRTGSAVTIGDIVDAGHTTIVVNNGILNIAAGGSYYTLTTDGAIAEPATGAFSSVGSVAFLGQRTIITEYQGRRISWSDVADGAAFNALNFATAESSYDDILRSVVIGAQLWIFKKESVERWYLTGSGDATQFIAPVSGATIGRGLKSFGLLATLPNGAFFVGSDNKVYMAGEGVQVVSARGVETSIANNSPTHCFYYQDAGQEHCVVRFGDRPAWVYDLTTGEWHERAEGFLRQWSATDAVKAWGAYYIGTEDGKIQQLTRNSEDVAGPLLRQCTSRFFPVKRRRVGEVQVRPSVGETDLRSAAWVLDAGDGFALDAGMGTALRIGTYDSELIAAQMMFEFSSDRGRTWGREIWRGLGAQGRFETLVRLRSLGYYEDTVTMRITISEPFDTSIPASLDVEVA